MKEVILYVYIFLDGRIPTLAGRLILDSTPRSAFSRFQYVRSYIENPSAVSIDPFALPLPPPGEKREYATEPGFPLFGGIRDAAPDFWGRNLMEEAAGRPLEDWEYLVAAGEYRIGDLAFGRTPDGVENIIFWDAGKLTESLDFSLGLEALLLKLEDDSAESMPLRKLVDRGASLGGSRPKATVIINNMAWIAKFNTRQDFVNNARVEFATMRLAKACGINVPPIRLDTAGDQDVFLIERFDRILSSQKTLLRCGMLSGITLFEHLNLSDARHAGTSYRDFVDKLRILPGHFSKDVSREVFRRMIFNIICGNSDDHLKNFAVLRNPSGHYTLSPAYDIMPQPQSSKTRTQILVVGDRGTASTIGNALSWSESFGFSSVEEARSEIKRITDITCKWKEFFIVQGVTLTDIDRLEKGHCFALRV